VVRPEQPRLSEDRPLKAVVPEDPQIELQMASVDVHVSRAPQNVLSRTGPEQLSAKVSCEFVLSSVASKGPRRTFTVAFPISTAADRDLTVTRFAASIDGSRQVSSTRTKWDLADRDGDETSYSGYIWPMTMGPGDKTTTKVEYSVLLPVRDGASSFTYILSSGAAWHGLVGRETIDIKADAGLRLQADDSGDLRPARQGERHVAWDIRNTDPREDVRVAITLDDGEARLRLRD
jgi:hypothetical protein